MRATNKDNNSALKRLIPAVAMLALSAVTLSTSTYAWFTMSKEVTMTGLNMTATSGGGMEIALASVSGGNIDVPTNSHPSDDENQEGWKTAVAVADYYSDIGKIEPASSVDGVNLFLAKDATNGGTKATDFDTITLGESSMAKAKVRASGDPTGITSEGQVGYYVDIPVFLRTSKVGTGTEKIYYKMVIKNNAQAEGTSGDELFKAIRVAFITKNESGESAEHIFACDNKYYEETSGVGKAVSGPSTKTGVSKLTQDSVGTVDLNSIGSYSDSGLKIGYSDGTNYGHLDFVVRVWLEGESKSCYDKNSGQSWSIDVAFYLGQPTTA